MLTHYDGVLLHWNFVKNEVNPVFKLASSQTFPEEWRGDIIFASGLLVKNDTTALIFRAPGIVEYNLKTTTERFIKFNKPLGVDALAISPDRKSIAVNTGNALISVYDFETWQLKFTFAFPAIHENKESPLFREVKYTHDGQYLVAVGSTGAVRPSYVGMFKANNGDFVGAFQSHEKNAKSLIVTPDDKFIVTAGRDGAKFWQLDDILQKFDKK